MIVNENTTPASLNPRYALIAGLASLVTVAILIALKSTAFWHSSSASVLASLIDSVIDAGVSLMTLFAIQLSLKPADRDHRFGHGKIEGVAALFQAAFITGAGLLLLLDSVRRFLHPQAITDHTLAVVVMIASIVLSLLLVAIQSYVLRKAPSLAVEADKAHYAMDIAINAGVIVVLLALSYGAPVWIDPAFALIIAVYLAFTVKDIGGKGIDMLLDRELPKETRDSVIEKVRAHEGVWGLHDLRTNKSGMRVFMSFDIEVNAGLSLLEAHEIAREVESALMEDFPLAEIMIHVDPHDDTEDTRHRIEGIHH